MNRVIASRKRMAPSTQAKYEDKLARNIQTRKTAARAIETSLKEAARWNPTDASCQTLSSYWNWVLDTDRDMNLWTPESRARWRDRTDAGTYFLTKARENLRLMMRLDKEAPTLGMSPTFQPDDLAAMLEDVNVKLEMLRRHRGRVGD